MCSYSVDYKEYSVKILSDFSVECYRRHSKVSVRHLLGFQHKLTRWSQLDNIIVFVKNQNVEKDAEFEYYCSSLEELTDGTNFLIEQLRLSQVTPSQRRYSVKTLHTAIQQYLCNRSGYRQLRTVLSLPNKNTIKRSLNISGPTGTEDDCKTTIENFFNLSPSSRRIFTLIFDEVYVLPAARYSGGHLIGMAEDDPTKLARTVLAIMVRTIGGKEAFVARLVPTYSLKSTNLETYLLQVVREIRKHDGLVLALISDNHPTNRSVFKSLHNNMTETDSSFIGCDSDDKDHSFALISDAVHLIKNIRNNWLTAHRKVLMFEFRGETIIAKWDDIVSLYENEADNILRRTTLSPMAVSPSSIAKQNMSLVLQIFNTKTIAALHQDGCTGTAKFVTIILKLWNILNVKNPKLHYRLNNPDCAPLIHDDVRIPFIEDVIVSLTDMKCSRGRCCQTLTTETRDALVQTLRGILSISKRLIASFGFSYVLTANFQSDLLESEFGIYRQFSGGMYYIGVEEIINCAQFRKLKLYHQLQMSSDETISIKCTTSDCCTSLEFTEGELESLGETPTNLSETEMSSLYYISGYITFKLKLNNDDTVETEISTSEFTDLVSRGKLKHPPDWLMTLASFSYASFKKVEAKCAKRTVRLYEYLADCLFIESNVHQIIVTMVNVFFKGLVRKKTDVMVPCTSSDNNQRKVSKLGSKK